MSLYKSSTVRIVFPWRSWMVESAFGSQPICITVRPFSARAAAMLETVVDLPMPPLPYTAILIIFSLRVCDDIGIGGFG